MLGQLAFHQPLAFLYIEGSISLPCTLSCCGYPQTPAATTTTSIKGAFNLHRLKISDSEVTVVTVRYELKIKSEEKENGLHDCFAILYTDQKLCFKSSYKFVETPDKINC